MTGHKIFEPKRLYAFSLEDRVPADHLLLVRAGNRPRMGRRGAELSAPDNPSRHRRSKIVENPLSSLSIDSLSGRRRVADLCCPAIL